jgi:O-antigen ligase
MADAIKFAPFGEIYGSELLLPIVAVMAVGRGGARVWRDRIFQVLVAALALSLAGYMVSDLAAGSRADQYLRGWGRVTLVLVDFAALSIVIAQDRRNLWWFVLGLGLGGMAYLRLFLHTPISIWKFGYSEPMACLAAAIGWFLPAKAAALWFGTLGVLSMKYDYRSFGAICFAVAGYVWVRSGRPALPLRGSARLLGTAAAGLLVVGVTIFALGSTEDGRTAARRASSNAGRAAALDVGIAAVSDSPVIGYGSWTEDAKLAELFAQRYRQYLGISWDIPAGVLISPHSQILQAWVEGGIFGAAFFGVLLYMLLKSGPRLFLIRPLDMLAPTLAYVYLLGAWNVFMSPFSAPHRVGIALAAVVPVLLHLEVRRPDKRTRARAPANGVSYARRGYGS